MARTDRFQHEFTEHHLRQTTIAHFFAGLQVEIIRRTMQRQAPLNDLELQDRARRLLVTLQECDLGSPST